MAVSRRNSALKFYVNGRRAKDLHGLTGVAGRVLSSFDTAVTRAVVGLKRRAGPAASRAVQAIDIARNIPIRAVKSPTSPAVAGSLRPAA